MTPTETGVFPGSIRLQVTIHQPVNDTRLSVDTRQRGSGGITGQQQNPFAVIAP